MGRWSMEDGEEPDALCGDCGDGLYAEELSTEGWERYGALLCPECLSTRITDEADSPGALAACLERNVADRVAKHDLTGLSLLLSPPSDRGRE